MNLSVIKEQEDYMVGVRRHLHENPELSGQEYATVTFIRGELAKMGIRQEEIVDGGVFGYIKGAKEGKTLLLRADMDALPMQEAKTNLKQKRTCISHVDGVAHTCGHDAHVAMLLGAAKILEAHKDELAGNLILCFERGEEDTWNIYQILRYIQEKKMQIDGAWGVHMHANLPSGTIGMRPGPVYAGLLEFEVEIQGSNPIDCFAAILSSINQIRTREISPMEKLTFSVGGLQAGTKTHSAPKTCTFSGTSRFYEAQSGGLRMKNALLRTVNEMAAAYGCKAVFKRLTGPTLSTIVNEECYAIAREAVGHMIGTQRILLPEPKMSTESFAIYATYFPSMFAFVGISNEEKGTGAELHNPHFDVDEDVMVYGAAATVAYAEAFLKDSRPIPFVPFDGDIDQIMEFTGAK